MNTNITYDEILNERRYPNKEFFSTLRFFAVLLAAFLCFTIIFTHILIGVQVVGSSMEPTLYGGDYLFINTLVQPEHGDIIVIEANEKNSIYDQQPQKWLIKRVIGLPGDTIYAVQGELYRKNAGENDFIRVDESYLGEEWTQTIKEFIVPENEIYILGDHRSISHDSRAFGTLPIGNIRGVVPDWSVAGKRFLTGLFGVFQINN